MSVLLVAGSAGPARGEVRNVLVLHYNSGVLPANVEFDRGLRDTIVTSPDHQVALFDEFLDTPRFGGEAYEQILSNFLREKYSSRRPNVIVVAGDDALAFVLRRHDALFPEVPVIHAGVFEAYLRSIPPLPPDVVGVPAGYDFSGTITQALRWHPRARRLVIVTGASRFDRSFEAELRIEVPQLRGRVVVEFLSALPYGEVMKRLGELKDESVVFTPGFFEDGAGQQFLPRETARAMAGASGAPVYGAFDTHLGTGIVGGRMPAFDAMGREAGRNVNAILAGAEPGSLRLPARVPARLNLDWRQVRRWSIDESAIPRDAVLHFRQPTFIEQYRNETIVALVVLLLQASLIGVLLAERRRRRIAEMAQLAQRLELAHASRLAVAGELTGSIAHEINQPLGAILSNTDAAELILEAGGDRREELRQILADIRRDDLRASEVIRRLRSLLARQEVERQPFELGEAVRDVESLLRSEARRRRVTIESVLPPSSFTIIGDRVQIQQVLINLVINAMDAVAELPEERRTIMVSVERLASGIRVTVRDRGKGVASDEMPKLFESFYSTKGTGMGLGLSIVRTIVEAHGGNVRAESSLGEGAAFHVELPEAQGAGRRAREER